MRLFREWTFPGSSGAIGELRRTEMPWPSDGPTPAPRGGNGTSQQSKLLDRSSGQFPPGSIESLSTRAVKPRSRRRYVLISPCRDEAKYARTTIESVLEQTELPDLWIIVDDGSTDDTPAILAEYAAKHPFIKIVTRTNRGERVLGSGVMEAFYDGLATVDLNNFDYVCKLDLDLDLPRRYFETIMNRMDADERLGAMSGKPYFMRDNQAISEKCGDEHAVGMSKFYRVTCFQQIGGFVKALMWDGIDTHRCRMKGWKAASVDGENLRFIHLRPMGSSHKSWTTGRVRHGRGQWFMGTGWTYMIASALFRMTRPPILVGGTAMLWGYVKGWWNHDAHYDDAEFRKFLRAYQWACMIRGKARATAELEARQAAVWKAPVSAGR